MLQQVHVLIQNHEMEGHGDILYLRIKSLGYVLQYTPIIMHTFCMCRVLSSLVSMNLAHIYCPPTVWNHPVSATVLPHSWWKYMSVSKLGNI